MQELPDRLALRGNCLTSAGATTKIQIAPADHNLFSLRGRRIITSSAAEAEGHLNRELIPQLEPLVERLNGWRGSLVEVVEQVSRRPGSLDRHCTTRSSLLMRLEYVGIAFSGASLMVLGKAYGRDVGYQATVDLLEQLSIGPDEVVFVERFGQVAERHSTFRSVPDSPIAEQGAPPDRSGE